MDAENLVSIEYWNMSVISDLNENSLMELVEEEFKIKTGKEIELKKERQQFDDT